MQQKRRLQSRLGNIRAVEPIFRGLETIALGNQAVARRKLREITAYHVRLLQVIGAVLPLAARQHRPAAVARDVQERAMALVVIGSERGLCGSFTHDVVQYAEQRIEEHRQAGRQVQLMSLGARTERILQRRGYSSVLSSHLSISTVPSYSLACRLFGRWLRAYESAELDAVEVVYNSYQGAGGYAPTSSRLLPPAARRGEADDRGNLIVETDPAGIYTRAMLLWLNAQFYALLLESAAAEHATRYRVLQGATENAERLIEELQRELRDLRREEITSEMADLIAGSGLLERRSANERQR